MELRNLLMILFVGFLLLTIVTLLFVPRENDDRQEVIEQSGGGCIVSCGNDAACVERCKTAAVNQAVILGDTSKCDVLPEAEKLACLEQLQFNQALAAGDEGQCAGLSFAASCKDLILFNRVVVSKDKSLCGQITDEKTRERCDAA